MKKILLLILILSFKSYSQEQALDSTQTAQKILFLESQLDLIKNQINDSRVDELNSELNLLIQARNSQTIVSEDLKEKIESLQIKLSEREKLYVKLQTDFDALSNQIKTTQSSISKEVESKVSERLNKLEETANATKRELTLINVSSYKSFVVAWYDLGNQLAAIGQTAQSILLFPEEGEKVNTLLEIGKYAGIAGGIAGVFVSQNNQQAGIATSGISLSITALLATIFKKKENQQLIENVSRNVAFTDEINAFSKIAQTFSNKSTNLYQSVSPHQNDNEWIPKEKNVTDFYSLISVRRDLTVVVRQMKAKAEYLLTLSLTNEGRKKLNDLIEQYNRALESWEASEIIYLSTYNYLHKLVKEDNS